MKTIDRLLVLGASVLVTACSTPLFPPSVTQDVTALEFGVLQAQPDVFRGQVVQLGGRIVGAEETKDGMLIRVQELPVDKHPVYGPSETLSPTMEFAILYRGKVDPAGIQFGNKLIVVALAKGSQSVNVDGAPRMEPYLVARCMHVWKTGEYGSYGIEDFPHTVDGYWPLEHETYCSA
ncbi:MAG TPA: Slp family lipoprotein [Terriglobia bacterium]|nr:Slp family lipoprotein [Terriglobia bacterium]